MTAGRRWAAVGFGAATLVISTTLLNWFHYNTLAEGDIIERESFDRSELFDYIVAVRSDGGPHSTGLYEYLRWGWVPLLGGAIALAVLGASGYLRRSIGIVLLTVTASHGYLAWYVSSDLGETGGVGPWSATAGLALMTAGVLFGERRPVRAPEASPA